MKRRALERHLRLHGARLIDEGANHSKWRGPNGDRSVVPRHNEIGPGVAIAICKPPFERQPFPAWRAVG